MQNAGNAEKQNIVERNARPVHGAKVIVSGAVQAKKAVILKSINIDNRTIRTGCRYTTLDRIE